jgi:hypothetical protein
MKPLCRETRDCEIWPDRVRDPRSCRRLDVSMTTDSSDEAKF